MTEDDKRAWTAWAEGRRKLARAGRHDNGSKTTVCTVETYSGGRTFRGNETTRSGC